MRTNIPTVRAKPNPSCHSKAVLPALNEQTD